jgi:ornithine cyclodeaminase
VNAVGASLRTARELDSAAVARARVFVDRRESAASEAGDLLIPRAEGAIGDGHVQGELGEVLLGRLDGRRTDDEITLFKSLGLAVEDVASAHHIHARARATGVGTWVELGGSRDVSG